MPLPDCRHEDAGFRSHVNDCGGQWAICLDCGQWVWLDADGKVAEYPGKHRVDSFHTRTDNGDDAGTGSQNERAI